MKNIQPVPYTDVSIKKGFWFERQSVNASSSLRTIHEQFTLSGRFGALRFDWKEGQPGKPHQFWDSDIAKWIEAACYVYHATRDEQLMNEVEGMIDLILRNQDPSGNFNIWFTVVAPDKRWKHRIDHELYCAGHLIEAAVAHYSVTGRDRFLRGMCRFADHIEQVFVTDRSAAFITPGHEEIELALVRLYGVTGERRYLELSRFFIDNRSKDRPEHFNSWANAYYAQDHLPVREQFTAEGHAVRATYLFSAMADLAREYRDESLFTACGRLFDDIINRKMYITGGIGSSASGESFTLPYDLPNLTAYSESCAAVGLAFFAQRMLTLEPDARYSDTLERVLYNSLLSSVSLDGGAFFYENPLEIDPVLLERDKSIVEGKPRLPLAQREKMFWCSCCPPNIARFIASVGGSVYGKDDERVYVHQYMDSEAAFSVSGNTVSIAQETDYPRDGRIRMTVRGLSGRGIALRIPGWCDRFTLRLNGAEVPARIDRGYAYLDLVEDTAAIDLTLAMHPRLYKASPHVHEDAGRVVVQRGPVVYCLEAIDNGPDLRDIALDADGSFELDSDPLFPVPVLRGSGMRRDASEFDTLYRPVGARRIRQSLKFIPYFGFANRGVTEMLVWVRKC